MPSPRVLLLAALAVAVPAPAALATIPGENGALIFARTYSDKRSEVWQFDRSSPTLESRVVLDGDQSQPTWCHDRLVWSRFATNGFRIDRWLQSQPVGIATSVTDGFSADRPSCAPSGEVAFSGGDLGNDDIWAVAPGGTPRRLTTDPAEDENPDWTPDGARIAFQSDRDGDLDVYVMNADGGGQAPLTNNGVDDGEPSWSPDGQRIAYFSAGPPTGVWVMNADGSGARFLAEGREPAWSPDGTRIAYRDATGTSGGRIWTMTPSGTGREGVSAGSAVDLVTDDRTPAWRPVRPLPVIDGPSAATPAQATAGAPGYRLRIVGSRFIIGSQVTWNGAPRPTTYVGPAELAVDLPASDLAAPGQATVGVRTPAPGGGTAAGTVVFRIVASGGATQQTGRPAPGAALTVTRASATGHWAASRLRRGSLALAGTVTHGGRVTVEVRSGAQLLTRRVVAIGAGGWRTLVPLPPGTLPGRLSVRLTDAQPGGDLPAVEASARVPAPPEGVAARSWISTSAGGPVQARLRGRLRLLVANFRLAAVPSRRRALAITWRYGSFARRVPTGRPESRLVTGVFGSLAGGAVRPGRWTATLTAGGAVVAIARVRVG